MKWTEKLDNELKRLIHIGKRHSEIAIEFKTNRKSIENRCFRLKIKTVYHQELNCKQCGKLFIEFIHNNKRQFCSKSCSSTCNGLKRVQTEETKEKIKQKLIGYKHSQITKDKITGENNPRYIDGRGAKINDRSRDKVDNKRKCKYCNKYKVDKKHKTICDECKVNYYEFYRPSCEFTFDINLYKNEFEFSLIKEYGWYSPANKGNNLNGVSRDHLYSVRDGFLNKINYDIIKHPANCKLLKQTENSSKHCDSSITLDELIERIKKWDLKYKKTQKPS